jgi:hypothetical protein
MHRLSERSLLCLALCVTLLAGCNRGPRRVPVSGSVTLDGEPVNAGVLHYYPDDKKGNEHRVDALSPARGGKYNLVTTAVRDSETGSGAPLGWYKVYLQTDLPGVDLKIHPRFTDANTTPILVEVVDNPAPGAYDIKFTAK